MDHPDVSPLGAVIRGAIAGVAGCATMDLFFAAFGKLMPPPRSGAFTPPETRQLTEMPPETLARRTVASVAMRGELARLRALEARATGAGARRHRESIPPGHPRDLSTW